MLSKKMAVMASRLHRQIIVRVGSIVFAMALGVAGICVGAIGWIYHKSDVEQVKSILTKVELLLQSEQDGLKRAVRDYAVWNDAYEYVRFPQRKFETDNFTQQSLQVMHLDFVAVLRSQGEIVFSSELVSESSDLKSTPAIRSQKLMDIFFKLPEWQNAQGDDAPRSYLTMVDDRPLLIGVSKISDSLQEKSSGGLMVFGRYLDGGYLERLRKLADSDLSITTQIPAKPTSALFYQSEQTAIKSLSGWQVSEIWLLVAKRIDWESRYFVIGIFISALLFVLLFAVWVLQQLLNKLVIKRVELFADLAWQRTRGERVYWPVEGDNELDLLARTFNGLMDEVQAAQQNLHTLSVTDALTTLGNRRGLEQEIELMIKSCSPGASMSMLLMDLDGFKLINDSLGHAAGDLLLQEVAQRMRQVMRKQDQLFRMGGDEFAVLMPNTNEEQAAIIGDRLLQQLVKAIQFGVHSMNVSGSIGIAQWDGNTNGKELMRRADLAMYAAKRKGKSCICFYEKNMSGVASEQMQLEQALRRAIQDDLIEPYFQPIMDVHENKILAVEMLARWQRDDQFIPPADFIRLAEDLSLINQLSNQLLRKGLTALKSFRKCHPDLKLQVNISPLQFSDRQLASNFIEMMKNYDLPTSALTIELTESAMLLYPEQVEQTMRQFVDAGVGLHLDDFGTGYSSLSRLRALPFDTVKLDRSFIVMLSDGDISLAKAVFDMASSMKMKIVAEGVESQDEFRRLAQIGYYQMQGFMFAEPMPEDELIQWLEGGTRDARWSPAGWHGPCTGWCMG